MADKAKCKHIYELYLGKGEGVEIIAEECMYNRLTDEVTFTNDGKDYTYLLGNVITIKSRPYVDSKDKRQ